MRPNLCPNYEVYVLFGLGFKFFSIKQPLVCLHDLWEKAEMTILSILLLFAKKNIVHLASLCKLACWVIFHAFICRLLTFFQN